MAAITFADPKGKGSMFDLATARTTDGVFHIATPDWAVRAEVWLSIEVAGTNTVLTIKAANPQKRDDANLVTLLTGATITGTGEHLYIIGDRGSAVAEVADAATGSPVVLQDELAVLPGLLTLDVNITGAVTYSLAVAFHGK